MNPDGRLSERLDPILRQLITERLAVHEAPGEEGGPGGPWVLTEVVQRRLNELEKVVPDPSKVALYFGHRCAVCQEFVATRRVEGRFVCTTCRDKASPAPQ